MSPDPWREIGAESSEVTSGAQTLYCEVRGEGPPLVLIHGWTLDQRVFSPQFADFAEHYQTISFDRRGYGRTGGTPDFSRELEDIDAVLDAFCPDRAPRVLGMSQGGRLALRYAITRPERVRCLALQGPALDQFAPPEREDERVPMDDFIELAREGKLEVFRQRWLAHPMMRRGIRGRAAALLERIVGDYTGRDLVTMTPATLAFASDVLSELARVDIPTLLLTGSEETQARKQIAAKILELMPRAEEVLLSGCGHMSNLGDPDRYNRLVLEFFAGN
jgi:pimeloyl-ACP methyl ester carboxylesterase